MLELTPVAQLLDMPKRTRAATKELENVSRIKEEKRELARVLTVIGEKKEQ